MVDFIAIFILLLSLKFMFSQNSLIVNSLMQLLLPLDD